ncbi:DUF3306 domain-containing protein [Bradyrhizobium archetypum]|uniref:DUF3306 domain-containing protein n=1 Tax=Bradyrhizobium archetypum TaxID=2721160 RepID=A0A7Y4H306_9BRAD|nr:DUF3306 domain-containing protein [Bradyrhizobium archetypum]NOJ45777.1 DUF3306 domain-containing protein [Bradyrhizobium archetypum]
MSGPDETDRDIGFLARWSQRKQEAKQAEPKRETQAEQIVRSVEQPATPPGAAKPEFDLSTLPKLEELTGSTDITAFFRKGVPEHLRNAALRKSWALDPAIRNYVSPALEYAYDWNAPGGVPGGGELGASVDVARMVSQIMGEPAAETTSSNANSRIEAVGASPQPADRELLARPQEELPEEALRRSDNPATEIERASEAKQDAREPVALDESEAAKPVASQQPVRRHGTAKPIV